MADLPVPRPELTVDPTASRGALPDVDLASAGATIEAAIPVSVRTLIETLREAGHAAYVVGGSVRDVLLGRPAADWDLATDATPERILALVPDAVYENRFGTVGVRRHDGVHEVTTFRRDHEYADFRRPHRVEFTTDLVEDLARRDFTVNAMAWGAGSDPRRTLELVDPEAGLADLRMRRLRAVGDPVARFEEDALRMIRAVRLATALGFEIEAATLAAMAARASLARHLSGERVAVELEKLLSTERPAAGLRLLAETGLLAAILPELAEQPGVPQNKIPGEDLWDHTLRTVDAAPADRPVVRLAALLHDIGKPATLADGHFHGHEAIGAQQTEALLRRLHVPRATIDRVVHLVRHHMFGFDPSLSDAAVRRLIRKIGRDALDELFALRAADDIGSGIDPDEAAAALAALRRRVDEQLAAEVALDRSDLAVDGRDLMAELGLEPGPTLGRILDDLLERVVADPALNDRPTLLLLAQAALAEEG
jgi:putative nucleotidyltransferase with HDIG domain